MLVSAETINLQEVLDMGITPFRAVPPLSDRDRQRFESKVERSDGCWLWKGWTRDGIGYGRFNISFQTDYGSATGQFAAHRVAYALTNGPISPGYDVLHSCDVPACVNPAHLRLGTDADNAWDKTLRGRHPRGSRVPGVTLPKRVLPTRSGERHTAAKCSDEQVRQMRKRYANDETLTATKLADELGMSKQSVTGILTGLFRKAAGGPTGKVRAIFGARVPNAKLSEAVVGELRALYATCQWTIYELAAKFGIAPQTVSNIIRFKTWKHVAETTGMFVRPGHRKLTKAQATKIRQRYAAGVSQQRLAKDYGVSRPAISMIVTHRVHGASP